MRIFKLRKNYNYCCWIILLFILFYLIFINRFLARTVTYENTIADLEIHKQDLRDSLNIVLLETLKELQEENNCDDSVKQTLVNFKKEVERVLDGSSWLPFDIFPKKNDPRDPAAPKEKFPLRKTVIPANLPHIRLFVGILSLPDYFDRRKAVRETYVNYLINTPYQNEFVYKFFVGTVADAEMNYAIKKEAELYGDLIILPFNESYYNISHKTFQMIKWSYEHYNTDYTFKADDDTFIYLPRLMMDLDDRPKERLYMGSSFGPYIPYRDKKARWYFSYYNYPAAKGPPYMGGLGYVISHDCAQFLAERYDEGWKHLPFEDVTVGTWLEQYGVISVNHLGFSNRVICKNFDTIVVHYVPIDYYYIFTENVQNGKPLCEDILDLPFNEETVMKGDDE